MTKALATMKDVGDRAGVSAKTVSNVLSGHPNIADHTRKRVLAAIDELNYVMNTSARSLRSGRTGTIALAVPHLAQPYFAELASEVVQAARKQCGWTVAIEETAGSRERELEVVSGKRVLSVDGLIIVPGGLRAGDLDVVEPIRPLVLLGEQVYGGPGDHIREDLSASRDLTEHMLSLGRRHIALIGPAPYETAVDGVGSLRLRGFTTACEAAGVRVHAKLVRPVPAYLRMHGAVAARELIESGAQLDGVVCANDALALGALRSLHELGVAVPDDVAVAGFDDIEESSYSIPSLTTMAIGIRRIAAAAVDLLTTRLSGAAPLRGHRELATTHELRVRESTVGAAESPSAT